MSDRHVRDIIFIDLVLSFDPPDLGQVQSLGWFAKRILKLYEEKKTSRWGREKRRKVRICDMSEINDESDAVTILLHFNDREGPDAAFCDMETDSQREEAKRTSEGRPETAHVMFKLSPVTEGGNRYNGLLEVKGKLNRSAVERYINWILKEIKKAYPENFEFPHPDGAVIRGKPHMSKVNPYAEIQGHLSEEFRSEIEAGKLSGIRLISKERKHLNTGETALVKPTVNEIKLEPTTSWREIGLRGVLDAMTIGKKADYSSAKISFSSGDGVSHSCEIDTDTGNVRGEGFVKKKRITRPDVLFKESEERIHHVIESNMRSWLNLPPIELAVEVDDAVVPTSSAS